MEYMVLSTEQWRSIVATHPDLWERWRHLFNSGLRGAELTNAAGINRSRGR